MAKHAKPTLTSTLSRNGARGAAALTMASAGFLATGTAALADGNGTDGGHGDLDYRWSNDTVDAHESNGVVNVADNTVAVPIQVCDNHVPVNVAGVQVPVQEAAAAAAVSTDGDGQVAVSPDSCRQTYRQSD